MQNNYEKSFKEYYLWVILGTLASFVTLAMGYYAQVGPEILLWVSLITYIGIAVVGIYKFVINWPTYEENWKEILKILFLNVARVGYNREAYGKDLPWKTVLTWGIAAAIISPDLLHLLDSDLRFIIIRIGVMAVSAPIGVALYYYLGYGLGLLFNKEETS